MLSCRKALALVVAVAPLAAGCGDDTTAPATNPTTSTSTGTGGTGQGGAGGHGGQGGAPACGTAGGALPAGLVDLGWDDGQAETNLRENDFSITVNNKTYKLNDEPLNEAVRFDLPHPAKIHGFSIRWGGVAADADPAAELAAGLYPDFGYNGFDFWEPDPLWTGTRCVGDLADGQGLTYVFDEPIVVEHPGLVYVAHRAEPGTPVFEFDGSTQGAGDCAAWDECHSSINMPKAQKGQFYNGVSFPFQYDYLVHLFVEYTEELDPADRFFQAPPVASVTPTAHGSFGDFDNDGFDDLVTDGPKLWRNDGNGSLLDVTASSGIAALNVAATGGVFGDYDNDGCLDLFLFAESYTAPDTLLRSNCDGTFSDVTAAAGIVDQQAYDDCGDPGNTRSPTAAAAWIDIDADGFLDLYEANFICWATYTYYTDEIWHSKGDGTFESWTAQHGFSAKKTASRRAAPIDADGDGDVDLFVNNYVLQANLFFDNQGDGTVVESAAAKGAAGIKDTTGYYGHTIGAAWGDLDNDGDFDLVSANLAHPRFFDFSDKTQVLLQQPDHTFVDITGDWQKPVSAAGLRYQETHSVPGLADFDQDGVLDMVITAVYDGRPTDFYWGNGDGTFRLDAYHAGITTENGWGVAIADIDHDGDPDLYASGLFENTLATKGHFLQVRAIGNVASNWAAIGATVRVTTGAVTRMRHVQGGTGKGGQDSMYLHFGLDDATGVDSIAVTFPGGNEVTFAGPFAADQRVWVYEDGTHTTGWAP